MGFSIGSTETHELWVSLNWINSHSIPLSSQDLGVWNMAERHVGVGVKISKTTEITN